MKALQQTGFALQLSNNQVVTVKAFLFLGVMDSPAKFDALNMVQHNSKIGACLHRTTQGKQTLAGELSPTSTPLIPKLPREPTTL